MKFTATALVIAAAASAANASLIVTEVRSKAASNLEDYFEITNTGGSAVDVTGWKFDDESQSFADAADLLGITSIAAGETVVFIQQDSADGFADVAQFRTEWGGLAGVQVGFHDGPGMGKGDGISLFNAAGDLILAFEYGMTSPEETHAGDWAAGNTDGSDTFEEQAAIWVPGTDPQEWVVASTGQFGAFQDSFGNWGSPGEIPAPSAVAIAAVAGLAAARRRRSA